MKFEAFDAAKLDPVPLRHRESVDRREGALTRGGQPSVTLSQTVTIGVMTQKLRWRHLLRRTSHFHRQRGLFWARRPHVSSVRAEPLASVLGRDGPGGWYGTTPTFLVRPSGPTDDPEYSPH